MSKIAAIFSEIERERERQDKKWGQRNQSPFAWCSVLGEEYGEVCHGALEHTYGNDNLDNYRYELIQVAAVAVAAIECVDRMINMRTNKES